MQTYEMKKTFYEKVGRRYVPVSEYDNELIDSYWKGSTLIVSKPGSTIRKYDVDPAFAPMAAAGIYAQDKISQAIMQASEIRMQEKDRKRPLTVSQKDAWDNLVKEFGDSARQLEWPSVREAAEAGTKAMEDEVEKMLTVPAVKHAYEQFLMVWKLTKDSHDDRTK
jgi:hypothetical protein